MKLLITGVSHKTAPVEVRECLAFREETLPAALADLKRREGVAEALILSTCNRVEVTVTTEDGADPRAIVDSFLADHKAVSPHTIGPHLYRHEGRDAIHHLFRVASSLDSMVIGEPQILGQLKAAYAAAKETGSVCGWLEGLLARAFGVAKRVRSETGIGHMAVSVSYAAVELARKIFGSLDNRTVMLAGAGKMSELAARHLRSSGASHVFVTNRTHERALEMAALFQGTPVEYTRFVAMLPEVDILIASSGAPHYILQEVVNANLRERLKAAERAEELVAEEVDRTMARLKVAEVTPTIVGLQEQLEQIRAGEIEKARRKYGPFTPEQEQAIEALTHGIVNKIAHGPISEIRNHAGHPDGAPVIAAIRKAFHLED
jgi:glutamyl-tRNA reductase